jgi:hypothetical protein
MAIVLSFVWFILFCLVLRKATFFRDLPGLSFPLLVLFFTLKVFAGMALIAIYTWYYTDPDYADVYKYFNDSKIMLLALRENPFDYLRMLTGIDASASHLDHYYDQMKFWHRPWYSVAYNDNRLMIRFNALVSLFSMGHLWVHNVFINMLSFSGMVALYKFFTRYSDSSRISWLPWGVFLFPGLLFWGSGILKEGMLMWAFGFWIYFADKTIRSDSYHFKHFIMLLLFSFVLMLLKPYTILLWIPCMLAFYLSTGKNSLKINLIYTGVIVSIIALGLIVGQLFPSLDFLKIIANKQNDFIQHSLFHDAGSLIHTDPLSPTLPDVTIGFVKGFFHALLRPHIFEAYSVVTLMAALENLMVVLMIVFMILRLDLQKVNSFQIKWAGLWFTLLMFGFVGMISVAYGGIVRYKIPALPFLWLFLIHMTKLPFASPTAEKANKLSS